MISSSLGWCEMNFSGDIPHCPSPTVKRTQLRSSIREPKEMRYSLQISPTSPDLTHKNDGETKGNEKQRREEKRPDECLFENLTPIEKEAKIRYERRMKQKQEREKNKDTIFFF